MSSVLTAEHRTAFEDRVSEFFLVSFGLEAVEGARVPLRALREGLREENSTFLPPFHLFGRLLKEDDA